MNSTRNGSRNDTLYRLGRALKLKGMPDGVIATTIVTVNMEHCRPPLPKDELEILINNVLTQAGRPQTAVRVSVWKLAN